MKKSVEVTLWIIFFTTMFIAMCNCWYQQQSLEYEINNLRIAYTKENDDLYKLWQDAQFDRATKQHEIEALQKKLNYFRKMLDWHGIRYFEDNTGPVLELAPPECKGASCN